VLLSVQATAAAPGPADSKIAPPPAAKAAAGPALSAERAAALWRDLASNINVAMISSRRVLLGTRDPNGPSCVWMRWEGDTALMMGDIAGGPGTQIVSLYFGPTRGKTPRPDYVWHQTVFKPFLEAFLARNQGVSPAAVLLAEQAQELASGIQPWTTLPKELPALGLAQQTHWAGRCAKGLDDAIAQGNLAACKRWADELAAATFAVADLHRWLDFLLKDHLTALSFQAQCEALFKTADDGYPAGYNPNRHVTAFPAGRLGTGGVHNYMEVERQAEWVFRVPRENFTPAKDGTPEVKTDGLAEAPAAVWVPPRLRATFVSLRKNLSPANQALWDDAAHSPFDRSYLANMLFRIMQAELAPQVGLVLQRYDKSHPQGTKPGLMGVVFYRAGDASGAADWGDRYEPRLMKIASDLAGPNSQVLIAAQRFTRAFFGGWENYDSVVTLREAIETRKMDCVRATDMIGALYRDSGHSGFYTVRWCAGVAGHSLAAAEFTQKGERQIYIVDGLETNEDLSDQWPSAYFRGTAWPAGYTGPKADIYAVELHGRGLDSYVWLEGYVIRGPNAGNLTRAPIPYLPDRTAQGVTKIYAGPYPDRPAGSGK
jgi:hypothetical protein